MALEQRASDEELSRLLSGCHATMKGRADAPAADGVHAWKFALDDAPLFALRWAFKRWLKSEEWMPTPADILKLAEVKARWMRALRRDCRIALQQKQEG